MDGGLALFGFGLFLFSIANLYSRTHYWLAWLALALALVSMGMAFSESKSLRPLSGALGVALGVLGLVALGVGVSWWQWVGTLLFAVAYGLLWAEFRFPALGHVRPEDVPPPRRGRGRGRWRLHLPSRRQRA